MLYNELAGFCVFLRHGCVTLLTHHSHAHQELNECAGCRHLETLGKAEASLQTALREVALLTAVLGGDDSAA